MTTPRVTLASRLRSGETIVTAWSSLAVPILGELMARAGYKAVALDMQHGMHDVASVREGILSVVAGGGHPMVRPPVDEFATASRALDLGAEAVIMPMVNSVDDALALVAATKYPPMGARSWGPHRAATLAGLQPPAYFSSANADTLAFAMIETPAALEALDDILALDGIDGVFVGPADLSLTLNNGTAVDPKGEACLEACADIARRARAAGRLAGLFCIDADHARAGMAMGYPLLALGIDVGLVTAGAMEMLKSIGE
ncbi:hydroxyacid aldolase [Stappia sp. F7233]|uniref:Hydroxyacid aldolase n=1 Tax=Stappia albiluteola TaxID=2758565 RepID=A0A839AFG6_9HYPH|nr:aldolase/citrate lyase family protein [Stappia albiluteola]MBA5777684.1 hydroxyacid aldolase [Stappia albiluteola]